MPRKARNEKKQNLTGKQRAFVDAYLGDARFNATEAAKLAGYSGNRGALQSMGSENLSKPVVREEIDRRLEANGVTAQEVLSVLADQMRATIADFVTVPEGSRLPLLDLEKAERRGKMHLIKKLWWTQNGPRIELHDPQRAAEMLGKALRLFVDRQEVDGEVVLRFAKSAEYREALGEDQDD